MMFCTKPLIAIIDDDAPIVEMLSEILSEEGYQTITCVGEHEAPAMIRCKKPDLVLLDMRLERPDGGWQILELIRSNPATIEIPVIICSADTRFLNEKEPQFRAQRCDILEKPFDLDMLLEKVSAAVGLRIGE